MKKIFLLIFVFAITACDQVKDEFQTSGGYVAPLLDKSTFTAVTQKEQLHRYYYIIALASPLALYTVSDEDGARDTILHVAKALKTLKAYDESLGVCTNRQQYDTQYPDKTKNCNLIDENAIYARDITETSYGFESNGLATQRAMARLASDIKNNVGVSLETSNPLDSVTSVLKFSLQLTELIGPMRDFAAAYRDTTHIAAFSMARLCQTNAADKPNCIKLQSAVNEYYVNGIAPPPTFIAAEGQDAERILKTLQLRMKNVIEKKELSQVGFFDHEALLALNAQIFTACMRAARLIADWDEGDLDKKYCSALEIPELTIENEEVEIGGTVKSN